MTTTFLQSFSGKLAERWGATLITPAFVFWAGGMGIWILRFGWKPIETWFSNQPEPLKYVVLTGSLLIIVTSAIIIQHFDQNILRFLEGYGPLWPQPLRRLFVWQQRSWRRWIFWRLQFLSKKQKVGLNPSELEIYCESSWPAWFRPLRRYIKPFHERWTNKSEAKLKRICQRLETLNQRLAQAGGLTGLTAKEWEEFETLNWEQKQLQKELNGLTAKEALEFQNLKMQLRQFPQPNFVMATRLGNLLRSAEMRPQTKYGLDAITCWPHLWLLLPDGVKMDLQEARINLNNAARVWLWSLLFTIWTIWAWWAVLLGIFAALFVYYCWMLDASKTYGDLIEATFDIYRQDLYKSLRWPLPKNPADEIELGKQVTEYLWSGSDQNEPFFE